MSTLANLQLRAYQITNLLLDADPNWKPKEDRYSIAVDFDGEVANGTDDRQYRFFLHIAVKPATPDPAYRALRISAMGIFIFTDPPSETDKNLLPVAPISLLYGVMRGTIAGITNTSMAAHLLPSLNFYEITKEKFQRLSVAKEPDRLATGERDIPPARGKRRYTKPPNR